MIFLLQSVQLIIKFFHKIRVRIGTIYLRRYLNCNFKNTTTKMNVWEYLLYNFQLCDIKLYNKSKLESTFFYNLCIQYKIVYIHPVCIFNVLSLNIQIWIPSMSKFESKFSKSWNVLHDMYLHILQYHCIL